MKTRIIKKLNFTLAISISTFFLILFTNSNLFAQDAISATELDNLFKSEKISDLIKWCKIIESQDVPSDYSVNIFEQPLFTNDSLITPIQNLIQNSPNTVIATAFLILFKDKDNEATLNFYLDILKNSNEALRNETVNILIEKSNPKIKEVLKPLLFDQNTRIPSFVDLAISQKMDDLQELFDQIYLKQKDDEIWKVKSLQYLSNFPKEKHRDFFRDILKDKLITNIDYKRYAALGLGKLKDEDSSDGIIDYCKKIRAKRESNCISFLKALKMIHNSDAKDYIASFSNSESESIKNFVTETLANWKNEH